MSLPHARTLAAALAVLAAVLAGCGPGVGGTGAGEPGSGSGVPTVCNSPLAALLACSAGSTGTARVLLADDAVPATALVTIEGERLELAAACAGFGFVGDWDGARFSGNFSAGGVAVPATLRLEGSTLPLQLRVFDASGTLRFGPVPVSRVTALPAGC